MSIHLNGFTAELHSKAVSYVLEVVAGKYLVHRYFGPAIRTYRGCGKPCYYKRAYSTEFDCGIENASYDDFPFEYPVRGRGDFRIPAFSVRRVDGIQIIEPLFRSWRVLAGKPELPGLPATFPGQRAAETLEVVCEDEQAGVRIKLYYSIFEGAGVIARHQRIENIGEGPLILENVQSASLELPARSYDFLSLYGTHAKEANRERFPLHHGIQRMESVRGSSSPQHQPFFALITPETSETAGEVYALNLIYSGNFLAQAEVDSFGCVRAQIGLQPDGFRWQLLPGGEFVTPEAILTYSSQGLNGMSRELHDLYQYHLMPSGYAELERPILLNSWESMYYDVSLDKIETQAELARQIGIELFVLDDGWFRADNSSRTSMGDWMCNEAKLPGGIRRAAELIHAKGMKFGLWFEPEAVCRNSDLYRQHPDWILHIPGYEPVEGRHEYLLDLTRQDVRDYVVAMLDSHLQGGYIDYIKWDMNRPLTDVNSAALEQEKKGETAHRYILGLYEILERITSAYPSLLLETCSSGGARFDPGILYYAAQNWASDNTDAYDRLRIQDGFSLIYPPVAIGAHISITPNHQTGRSTPPDTRFQTARLFNLGYELDLTQYGQPELAMLAQQISIRKAERKWLQAGIFSRHEISNPNYVMWSVTSRDRSESLAVIFQKLYDPLFCHTAFRMLMLDESKDYLETESGEIYGGDELMKIGLTVPLVREDFHSFVFHFQQIQ